MRRSTRRSSMAVSIHQSLEFESSKKINTRRSSSIVPNFDDTRNVVGNFTSKFSMSSFVKKVEELTHDQRTAIEKVGFGNLLNIHQHTLRKNLLVEWMERWDSGKRAFVIHGKELTITAIDAALILGLRATGNPISLSVKDPLSELEKEYGATNSSRKVAISSIEQRLQSLGDLATEDFIRTFLLFIFGTILFPSSNSKIDSRYLFFLKDLNEVPNYGWGMAVAEELFNCLSKRKEEDTKSMEGCLLLLQIWSYEHVDIGRPNLLSSPLDFPRACRWDSSRCNSPRHWFTTKFNELEENQVNWKLQPTTIELNIDIIKELLGEEDEGREFLLTRTNPITTSMLNEVPSKNLSVKAVSDVEPEGHVGRGKNEQQADIQEHSMNSKHEQSSELSSLVEGTEGLEVISTRTSTKMMSRKMGLPPKSCSQYAIVDQRGRGTGRSKLDATDVDLLEDSRQSTDASVITEDFTECTSSYNLQENHIPETSRCVKTKKSNSNDVVELMKENAMLRSQLSLIPQLEEVILNLRKEVAELKADNQRLRAPPPADNVEKLIDAYFSGVSDASEVDCFR